MLMQQAIVLFFVHRYVVLNIILQRCLHSLYLRRTVAVFK